MPTSKPRLPAQGGFGNHWLVRYVFALMAVAAGFLLRSGLTRLAGGRLPTYITFYPAVMLSALLGGFGPGLVATLAAAIGVDYFILPPLGSFTVISPANAVGLAFFTGTSVFMSVVAELYRRARQQAEALLRHHRDDLQEMVAARTEELGRSNEQLKEAVKAHARLAAIVESSDDAILSKDLDGNITSWNRGAERMFGYRPVEVIGRPINLLLPRDRQDEEVPIMARIQADERVDHFETVRLTKDGRSLAVSVTISPLNDGGGRIIGASKIVRDISARLRAEQRTALLAETASRLLSSDDPQRVVDELCGKVLEFLDCQVFFNFLVDDKQQRLHLNACAGIAAAGSREDRMA